MKQRWSTSVRQDLTHFSWKIIDQLKAVRLVEISPIELVLRRSMKVKREPRNSFLLFFMTTPRIKKQTEKIPRKTVSFSFSRWIWRQNATLFLEKIKFSFVQREKEFSSLSHRDESWTTDSSRFVEKFHDSPSTLGKKANFQDFPICQKEFRRFS